MKFETELKKNPGSNVILTEREKKINRRDVRKKTASQQSIPAQPLFVVMMLFGVWR